jgi:serine phosphatase RsbU (regulator of sigma subunit)
MSREIEAQRRAKTEKLQAERRAAQDLEIAKMVQARLFPQMLPSFPTLDYAGVCTQALSVGGDYYDFLDLGQERIGLVVGDISGKGIAAALLMANLQANLRSRTAVAVENPEEFLASVNRLFHDNTTDNAFATVFFAEYDNRCQCMRYANCGHLPAILLRGDGSFETLNPTATVLGVFRDWNCTVEHCAMHPGDVLALYTDGVTEAFNSDEEEFGEARLVDALRRYREEPARSIVTSIVEEVRRFSTPEQHDDITLIVAKCCSKS